MNQLPPAEQIAILETGILAAVIALRADEDGQNVAHAKLILEATIDKAHGILDEAEVNPVS